MVLPIEIKKHVLGMKGIENIVGCTEAKVIQYSGNGKTMYLKIDKKNEEFTREQKIYNWLKNKLSVPSVVESYNSDEYDYLLLTEAKGIMAADDKMLIEPTHTINSLAKGIKELQKIVIKDCPFDSTIEYKLEKAKKRIEKGLVSLEGSVDCGGFKTPQEIYDFLVKNKPTENLVFTHGDYCLPNVLIDGKDISFIDLGRAGIGDIWQDIALCVRSLKHNFGTNKYSKLFFEYLEMEPDYDKINYYILLDELF